MASCQGNHHGQKIEGAIKLSRDLVLFGRDDKMGWSLPSLETLINNVIIEGVKERRMLIDNIICNILLMGGFSKMGIHYEKLIFG